MYHAPLELYVSAAATLLLLQVACPHDCMHLTPVKKKDRTRNTNQITGFWNNFLVIMFYLRVIYTTALMDDGIDEKD